MRPILQSLVVLLFLATSTDAAFEITRALVGFAPFDPHAPYRQSSSSNPAVLTLLPSHVFASAARPFGLQVLDAQAAGMVIGRGRFAGALAWSSLGQRELYQETDATFSLAVTPLHRLHLGAGLHRLEVRLGTRFEPVVASVWDAGLWLALSDRVGTGVSVTDAGAPNVVGRPLLYPRVRLSVSYLHSEQLSLQADAQRWQEHWSFAIGQTVVVASSLYLSADLQTEPLLLRLGIRFELGRLSLGYTYRDHPDLGGDQMVRVAFRLSSGDGSPPL